MTGIFITEMLSKVLVFGFACNGPNSYLKSGWNVADFAIVMVSIFGVLPFGQDFQVVKVVRLLRVFRPLRMISRDPGMKIVVESLVNSVPGIINLMVITLLIMLLFAILGTTFYKGLFRHC